MPIKSFGGSLHFITFIDDYYGNYWVYLLKDKTKVIAISQKFHAFTIAQPGLKLKYLMTNNGEEYIGTQFTNFCAKNGIKRELTTDYNPTSNSMAV